MSDAKNNLKFVFAGRELTLSSRVKHKYVRRAQNLMTEWMMQNVDVAALISAGNNEEASMSEMLRGVIMEKPKLAMEIQDIENSIILDQTIMLASGLDYAVLIELKEEAYEDEYIELYKTCSKLLGGNANDFFEVYRTGLTSKRKRTQVPRKTRKKVPSASTPQE